MKISRVYGKRKVIEYMETEKNTYSEPGKDI